MSEFIPGDQVQVVSHRARLQMHMVGIVMKPKEQQRPRWTRGYVLVKLPPNPEGRYGGLYWFRPEELRPAP